VKRLRERAAIYQARREVWKGLPSQASKGTDFAHTLIFNF